MIRSIPRRTATSVLSMSSRRLGHGAGAREKYLRLAKLEFEKTHQTNHLQRIRERASEHEQRIAEIDREQGFLLTSATAARKGEPMPSAIPRRAKPAALKRQGRQHAS